MKTYEKEERSRANTNSNCNEREYVGFNQQKAQIQFAI